MCQGSINSSDVESNYFLHPICVTKHSFFSKSLRFIWRNTYKMDLPAFHSFSLFALLLCPLASDSERQHSRAPQTFRRETFRLMKTKGACEGGRTRGDGHLCAFAVYRRELWWLSRARPSSETVECTPKGKRLEPSRIIRLGEQSVEVGRGRHVRPDSDAVYPTALCRKTRPRVHHGERERMGQGREEGREIYPPKNRECIF